MNWFECVLISLALRRLNGLKSPAYASSVFVQKLQLRYSRQTDIKCANRNIQTESNVMLPG